MQSILEAGQRWASWIVLFVLIVVATVSMGVSYYAHLHSNSVDFWAWLDSAAQNFSTEMMGAVVTFALLALLTNRRAEARDLIIQMRSPDNTIAATAVERFVARNWHRGNLLQKVNLSWVSLTNANLSKANLQQAHLQFANLRQMDLQFANLRQADLRFANLQQVDLEEANLRQANLDGANLQGIYLGAANLREANLYQVNLQGVDLQGAKLQQANLQGANLQGAKNISTAIFDEKTVLPDAKLVTDENGNLIFDENKNDVYDKYWRPETDMTRYTNPEHPDFWQPDYLKPGYGEKGKPGWARKQAED